MGTVYRAERADGAFSMLAAVKLIRRQRSGLDERLKLERALLARLDHRHIARLIDGGTTEDDQVYLVMEWVEGLDLAAYINRHQPGLDQCLNLFEQIGGAVAHAHQRRVVHGDLKPGNVMVTADHQARLVDFGVGRLLTEDADVLSSNVRALTPAFSAPEQRAGEEASTQSDVWALGRLLHWLIEPAARSSGTTTNDETDLTSRLPRGGDLIAILEKAGAPSPDARYAGVVPLLEDVRRYRQRRPVDARNPVRSYLLKRFVQRHRLAVGAGVLTACLLCLVAASALWQAFQATHERDRANLQLDRAVSAELESEKLADDLQQVVAFQATQLARIDSAAMGSGLRRDIQARHARALEASALDDRERDTRREALTEALAAINFTDLARDTLDENFFSAALASIEAQFETQPLVRARLLQTVATSMREAGLRERALETQEQAYALRRDELGPDHLDTLDAMDHLGLLYGLLGRHDEQGQIYEEALAGYRRVVGDDDSRTLNAMSNLGVNLNARGKLQSAERYLRTALEGQRRILGEEHRQTLITTHSLGYMIILQGRHDEALPYYDAALTGRQRLHGNDHPDTLTAMNNYGYLLKEMDRLEDALPYYEQALEGRRRLLGNEHQKTLQSVNNLGHLLSALDRLEEARPLVLEALEQSRSLLGDDHRNTLIYFNNAGRLHQRLGRYREAEALYRQAVDGARANLPADHWHTASFLSGHAGSLKDLDRFEEAETGWMEAHAIFEAALGTDHERTVSTASELAQLYETWHKAEPEHGHDERARIWHAQGSP